jgi:hypothetical protein
MGLRQRRPSFFGAQRRLAGLQGIPLEGAAAQTRPVQRALQTRLRETGEPPQGAVDPARPVHPHRLLKGLTPQTRPVQWALQTRLRETGEPPQGAVDPARPVHQHRLLKGLTPQSRPVQWALQTRLRETGEPPQGAVDPARPVHQHRPLEGVTARASGRRGGGLTYTQPDPAFAGLWSCSWTRPPGAPFRL